MVSRRYTPLPVEKYATKRRDVPRRSTSTWLVLLPATWINCCMAECIRLPRTPASPLWRRIRRVLARSPSLALWAMPTPRPSRACSARERAEHAREGLGVGMAQSASDGERANTRRIRLHSGEAGVRGKRMHSAMQQLIHVAGNKTSHVEVDRRGTSRLFVAYFSTGKGVYRLLTILRLFAYVRSEQRGRKQCRRGQHETGTMNKGTGKRLLVGGVADEHLA